MTARYNQERQGVKHLVYVYGVSAGAIWSFFRHVWVALFKTHFSITLKLINALKMTKWIKYMD